MVNLADRPTLDPYVLTRELTPAPAFWSVLGAAGAKLEPPARFLGLHVGHQTSHVLYRFPTPPLPTDPEDIKAAVQRAATPRQIHIQRIEKCIFEHVEGAARPRPWVVTPFAGDVDGVRPLSRLLKEKNGQMPASEVERALVQLLEALQSAHGSALPLRHGVFSLDHVLVDRHGSLAIELYALADQLAPAYAIARPAFDKVACRREEVRSVVEIGYMLLTGLRAESPLIPAGRIVKNLDPRWDDWFARGLSDDPALAFDHASEAASQLPMNLPPRTASGPRVHVRSVLNWIRQPARL